MSFAIGFGSHEQEFERAEEQAFKDFVTARYHELDLDYFTDDLVKEAEDWIKDRADEYHAEAAAYKTSEYYPTRYGHYWPHIVSGASDIIAVARFLHINRRHALSPDGWAMLSTKALFHVCSTDMIGEKLDRRASLSEAR